MNDRDCGHGKRREAWRMEREMKRAAWRARWAARRANRGDWSHFKDPKFWGLDAESMKQWGFSSGSSGGATGFGPQPAANAEEVAQLLAKVAEMEKTMASMHQRIIVLEKLVVDDEARIAREIDRLRDTPDGGGR